MKKLGFYSIIAFVVGFALIQLIPVGRRNPPVEMDISTLPDVKAVLQRACYDCHSNQTVWPWYSHIAPVSWLVARDVYEGRAELNFSIWNRYSVTKQTKKLKESWREVEQDTMPPWWYTILHHEARLSAQDRARLRQWAVTTSEKSTDEATPRSELQR